ncbi:MAG TPA: hypothetical protein GX528_07775 [Firmicutes bacterium]|nr:hypothetical protein [Bacillota bacterium]
MKRFRNQILRFGPFLVLGIFLFVWWLSLPAPAPKEESAAEGGPTGWRTAFSQADLDLLARAVRAEAQGEPYDGQVAVAAVILNRVRHPEFPNTIPGVVYEPLAFSVVANGQIYQAADSTAKRAAHDALNGLDPTGGALYFYNPKKARSAWIKSRPVIKTIGKHIFSG